MNIGINATCLNDRPTGAKQRFVGIYGVLFKHLPNYRFYIYEPIDCAISDWFKGQPNVIRRQTPFLSVSRYRKLFRGITYWKRAIREDRLDIFEHMHLPLLKNWNTTTFLTIHDIRSVRYSNQLNKFITKSILKSALNQSNRVITVSSTMSKEIENIYSLTPIAVIPNGVDVDLFKKINIAQTKDVGRKINLPSRFILSVGHFEARKSYGDLVNAFSSISNSYPDLSLVIIGNDSGSKIEIEKQVENTGLSSRIYLISDLDDFEVKSAYCRAEILVFPSSYEGFGIPILEAMAAELPMVLSDLPVFREITQNQSIYFTPSDIEGLAQAMILLLGSRSLKKNMVKYGKSRIKEYNYYNLAAQLADIYRQHEFGD